MINQMSSNANIHPTGIILRDSFLTCQEWYKVHKQSNYKTIFTITSGSPYKGLHVTLRALSVLKKKYPDIKLRIAGLNKSTSKLKTLCYSRYLSKLIDTLDISENVEFLGNMDEFQLLEEMYDSLEEILLRFKKCKHIEFRKREL
jgi:glycosyltransferase involved in cell wall biosynthesis